MLINIRRTLLNLGQRSIQCYQHVQIMSAPVHDHAVTRMASNLPDSPIFRALTRHVASQPAIIHSDSQRSFTYGSLLQDVVAAKIRLSNLTQNRALAGERIAFLAENSYDYVVTFLSIIAHDAIALPISPAFPNTEIHYILENSGARLLLSSSKFQDKAREILNQGLNEPLQLEILPKTLEGSSQQVEVRLESKQLIKGGFMLYTSGTTDKPKGVVLSTPTMIAQAESLIQAWEYKPSDLLLHVLPLHHIHGTINALFTPLMAGATIEFAFPFNADRVWKRFAAAFKIHNDESKPRPITFFTVVPTIYSRLLNTFPALDDSSKGFIKEALLPKNLRLNISGSAALPEPIKTAWSELSGGNVLLERYGMTEVGMALSCGLNFSDRVDGSVGWPLPSVEVRLVDTETGDVIAPGEEIGPNKSLREGEIQLRGPTVFTEYWRNPQATETEFLDAADGKGKWFKTGDIAVRHPVSGAGHNEQSWATGPMYFIRGRKSVDIIKTGGEKVSALEVERELLSLPEVAEAAVVGVPSEQWGQKVAAVIVLTPTGKSAGKGGKPWHALDMRRALKEKLASYKIPQDFKIVESIPRNAMGKINKKALIKDTFQHDVLAS